MYAAYDALSPGMQQLLDGLRAVNVYALLTDDGLVLIDTGLGNKEDAKFMDIYGVENAGIGAGTTVGPGSLVTRGDTVPAATRWLGNPITTWR